MAKSALLRWQMGMVLILVTLGLLGALLAHSKPCKCGRMQVEVSPGQVELDVGVAKKTPTYQAQYEEAIKWAFYVFVWLLVLYFYAFTVSSYKNSLSC